MRRYDLISSLFWLMCAVLIIIGSLHLSVGTITNPGPGFYPLIIACLLGIIAIIVFISAIRKILVETKPFWADKRNGYLVAMTILSLLIYTAILPLIGFVFTTFLLMLFLFKGISGLNWKVSLGGAILTAIIFYALFQVALRVEFPIGLLGV